MGSRQLSYPRAVCDHSRHRQARASPAATFRRISRRPSGLAASGSQARRATDPDRSPGVIKKRQHHPPSHSLSRFRQLRRQFTQFTRCIVTEDKSSAVKDGCDVPWRAGQGHRGIGTGISVRHEPLLSLQPRQRMATALAKRITEIGCLCAASSEINRLRKGKLRTVDHA